MLGHTFDRQGKNVIAICEEKGLNLDRSFDLKDAGIRAFDGSNRKLGKLAAFLDAVGHDRIKPGSILIIEDIDRLTREDITDALSLFMSIISAGITIYVFHSEQAYSKEILHSQPFLIMGAIMSMILAHEESEKKSKLSNAWWTERRSKAQSECHPLTPTCPAWLTFVGEYKMRNGKMRPNLDGAHFDKIPSAVATIKRIFKRIIAGDGLSAVTAWLVSENVPLIVKPGKKRGLKWCRSTVHYLLKNRELLGEFQPHIKKDRKRVPIGDLIPGYYPAIIDEKTFDRVQRILKKRRVQAGPQKNKGMNIFSGLLRMNEMPMHLVTSVDKKKKKTWYYLASAGRDHGEKIGGRVPY